MGNQARVMDGATVVSSSTRNFPNRLGTGARVFLASAELAAVASLLGYLPTVEEYLQLINGMGNKSQNIYQYLNFDLLPQYTKKAETIIFQSAVLK